MRTRSVYRLSDGLLTGAQVTMAPWDDERAAASLPPGCAFVDGAHDHRTRRVDLKNGEVVAHDPPPDPEEARRQEAYRREGERRAIQKQIDALEAKQARAIREHLLDVTDEAKVERLRDIDRQIAELRARRPV